MHFHEVHVDDGARIEHRRICSKEGKEVPYWLMPAGEDEGAARAYRLLLGVMEQTDRAALGQFVMRAKEHLAIVRARDGALTLTTMRFHDEVRATKDVPSASGKSTKPAKVADGQARLRPRGSG